MVATLHYLVDQEIILDELECIAVPRPRVLANHHSPAANMYKASSDAADDIPFQLIELHNVHMLVLYLYMCRHISQLSEPDTP